MPSPTGCTPADNQTRILLSVPLVSNAFPGSSCGNPPTLNSTFVKPSGLPSAGSISSGRFATTQHATDASADKLHVIHNRHRPLPAEPPVSYCGICDPADIARVCRRHDATIAHGVAGHSAALVFAVRHRIIRHRCARTPPAQ